jgi:hypothetical protein
MMSMWKCHTVVAGERKRERDVVLVILFLLKNNLASVLEVIVPVLMINYS